MRSSARVTPSKVSRVVLSAVALAVGLSASSQATPYDYIPVGDPLEAELRLLDLLDFKPLGDRIRIPHLWTRPLQAIEMQGPGPSPAVPDPVRAISLVRLERALGRDRADQFAPHPRHNSTPRLLDHDRGSELLQLSVGLEGVAELAGRRSHLISGSGIHGRLAVGLDRLVAYSHYVVGRINDARLFADPIVAETDVIVLPEETYLSYTEQHGQWSAQIGRGRWHWGPGEEGSLTLSKTSPLMTGFAFRTRLEALRADAITLAATLEPASHDQLAAHRIEWRPVEELRIGVTETASYRSPGWKPLYMIGIIPYVLVQRLEWQPAPDSLPVIRNNVLTAVDATWRVAEGTRVYGEFLVDDLQARTGKIPNKYAFQLGWEGVGPWAGGRLAWGGEYTRITRFVYTSFFDLDHAIAGRSLGFPVAPDVRRARLRTQFDPNPDWQLSMRATHTDKGENDIDEPFRKNDPPVNSSRFEGVVEITRELELGVRWWPASGVNLALRGSYRWIDNPRHQPGTTDQDAGWTLEVHLLR